MEAVSIHGGKYASITQSNIPGMLTGKTVSDEIVPDLAQLVECVKEQSSKFQKISEEFNRVDDSISFEGK
ncbi:hypothetical protein [Xylocopilactobacillus apicola]|uniref:Uncharacterized protein n=1 Tax=Xylocopilactobacillus apicola TaxID=2932184 RepID=A0AAU9D7B7_9LACO|nr:hypothetical protein [Xylocopilactobacillus apicola]BDR59428.1 hypothetical protein XA3_18690 [Xylocopilactobacillus apicola]